MHHTYVQAGLFVRDAKQRRLRERRTSIDLGHEVSGRLQPSYVSGDLAEWLQGKGMKHSRGAPYHPQTQGKIGR